MSVTSHSPNRPGLSGWTLNMRFLQFLKRKVLVLAMAVAVAVAVAGNLGAQVIAAPAAQAVPGGLGTEIRYTYGVTHATIAMDECGDIQLGTIGSCVASTQYWLNTFDNAGIPVDGQFGPATQQALINYQVSRGLPGVGVVRSGTRQAFADDYNKHFGGPDFHRGYQELQDFGGLTWSDYHSWGSSVALAREVNNNAATLGGAAGVVMASGCKQLKIPAAITACAAYIGISTWQLIDVSQQILNGRDLCMVERTIAGTSSYRLETSDNRVYCQIP